MMKLPAWLWILAIGSAVMLSCGSAWADDVVIQSFDDAGRLTFKTLNDGTNHKYQVEWAPSPAGPWSPFTGMGAWLDSAQVAPGGVVTSSVPMCYRVVATPGDYLVLDLAGGPNATQYPANYCRSLADVPGGADDDAYKTTKLLLRRIPAGTFTMGSPTNELGRSDVEVQHQVTLTQPFYIGIFPVTQKQWERVVGNWPSWFTNAGYRDARPVESVSYDDIRGSTVGTNWPATSAVDASSFMGLLRARTGMAFDLPTEAQWEYAGRAGTDSALNSGYNLTNTDTDAHMAAVGRYGYNGGFASPRNGDTTVGTAKVGSYQVNAWGLYDIHGNVWQWCLDRSGAYPGTVSDPRGAEPSVSSGRIFRGGGCGHIASWSRSAFRNADDPSLRNWGLGFRLALPSGQ